MPLFLSNDLKEMKKLAKQITEGKTFQGEKHQGSHCGQSNMRKGKNPGRQGPRGNGADIDQIGPGR